MKISSNQQYPVNVVYSSEDEGFIAIAPDLPGCSAFGSSQEEAIRELQDAIEAWKGAAIKAGNAIPSPSTSESLPSGKILLRLPRSLHAAIVEISRRDQASLNTCIVGMLSAAVAAGGSAARIGQTRTAARPRRSDMEDQLAAPRMLNWSAQLTGAENFVTIGLSEHRDKTTRFLDVRSLPAGKPVVPGASVQDTLRGVLSEE